tara:strand:- start:951 stop:2459 length:1509 start_codon:yes stop_codon:yes gene_type:complete
MVTHIPSTRAEWEDMASQYAFATQLFIDGNLTDATNGGLYQSINPATGAVIAKIAVATATDVDRAVAVARQAFSSGAWSKTTPRERMDILLRFARFIEERTADFALLDSLEMGKPVSSMVGFDVPSAVANLRFSAEAIDKLEGAVTNTKPDVLHYILRQPLGVVGLILPWNYPMMMACWKLGPALAMGNSVIIKPAQQTSLSAILLAQLFSEAGGPDGVFNVIPGSGSIAGQALARHMDVDKIGFTGSGAVGGLMMRFAGESNLKHVTTECGGKSAQVILADCDLDAAVEMAVHGVFSNQGEVCAAGSRILVQESILYEFHAAFEERTKANYAPGNPLDPKTTMGPIVDERQHASVMNYIAAGRSEGACLAFGGRVPNNFETGCYIEPTLFSDVTNTMKIAKEEIFGPVGVVIPIKDVDHGIAVANASIFGLGSSIWTRDLSTAHKFAREIEAGMVWVNTYFDQDPTAPWGGFKQSGNGRDKCLEALSHYSQTKSVWVNLGA